MHLEWIVQVCFDYFLVEIFLSHCFLEVVRGKMSKSPAGAYSACAGNVSNGPLAIVPAFGRDLFFCSVLVCRNTILV
jgi:hypothetical protein